MFTNTNRPSMCWGFARRAVVATTTVTGVDRGYTIDATSGTYDVALTAAATLGDGFVFGVYNSGSGTVTINPNGAETIRSPAGSATTLSLTQGQGVLVMCDGTGFEVVANATIPTSGTNTGDVTLAAVGAVPNANAASLSGQVLNLQPADGSNPGVVTIGAQTIAGVKTLSSAPIVSALTASRLVRTDGSKALESNAALTNTYVLYADSNGWPTGSSSLTWVGTLLTITGTIVVTSTATLGGDLIFTAAPGQVRSNVDNSFVKFAGGSDLDPAKGAGMVFFGNTQASLPGSLFIDTGNASTAATNFRGYNNNALLQATSNGNTGVGTGFVKVQCTDAATTAAAAGFITLGGAAIAKGVVSAQMCGTGVASTATAAGTTTLTISSAPIQIFTGATTQTIQFPAANLFGAGISVKILVINRSSGTVTPTRAGADTFVGGGTTDPILTTLQVQYVSDGVSVWYKLAV